MSPGDDPIQSDQLFRSRSTSGSPLRQEPAVKSTTSMPGWTCLLSGLSGDQNPHLLRHLAFDDSDMFGDHRWRVWRVDPRLRGAAYLTLYSNQLLDCSADMYNYDDIERVFSPYQDELINVYYTFVHPSYPILERKEEFIARRTQKQIPCSLLAVVYSHACYFWEKSPALRHLICPNASRLRPYIYSILTVEIRTPNLNVLQAMLLYLQLPPLIIRESNHPGHWAMTTLAVAIAQDIGLHVDPEKWKISLQERKLRRVLWWSVYVHDKWMAHWLGRPSHIRKGDWAVQPLTLSDFANADGMLSVDEVVQGKIFITLCELSEVLSEVLDSFYSIRSNVEEMDIEQSASLAQDFMGRLQNWRETNGYLRLPEARTASAYTAALAGCAVETLVRRAHAATFPGEAGLDSNSDPMASMMNRVFEMMRDILENRPPQSRMWLSYNRGNLMTIGSHLITMVLRSTNDEELETRRGTLLEYRGYLGKLAEDERDFEFARLPLRRLNLIISELFGRDDELVDDIDPGEADDLSGARTTSAICRAAFNVAVAPTPP
ncbi:hypothetical protein LTR84_011787 [Exophiala bonariae]|uniref:Xylanolytic transcriptional activator regulatory domain-containing protein n=1 Tax=Exophiala bonariae TaxID=1690606 RepID=A0AAV9NJF2_9EURO|nr:hypothetical protein LTR84_011787 [Exophiala bonariae]